MDWQGQDITAAVRVILTDALGKPMALVDTSQLTAPDQPLMMTYHVVDTWGFKAQPVVRHLVITCRSGTSACSQGAEPRLECMEPAVCSMQQGPAVTASGAGLASATPAVLVPQARAQEQPPSLVLVGSSVVYLQQGDVYARCSSGVTTGAPTAPCDRGAAAVDPADGDLTALVEVMCTGLPRPVPFASVGLSRCAALNSSAVPGTHTLQFQVANSRGLTSTVYRTVVVSPKEDPTDCMDGELGRSDMLVNHNHTGWPEVKDPVKRCCEPFPSLCACAHVHLQEEAADGTA